MSANQKYTMLCIDGSEHSERALEWYFEHMYNEGDQIGLIHVHVLPDIPAFGLYAQGAVAGDVYQHTIERSIEESKEIVKKYRALCEGKGAKVQVFIQSNQDSVGQTICNIAKDHASMIIMGQRGLGKIRRTLFGSVSDYVLHHAHIPMIVVPPVNVHTEKE